MKKATTYYFLLLLCLNAFFAWYLTFAAGELGKAMHCALGGAPLPLLTQRFMEYHWWPWVAVVVALIGAITSVTGRVSDRILSHALVCFLILELWVMFTVAVALALPWVTLDWRIAP
jgi:hypothetical protein